MKVYLKPPEVYSPSLKRVEANLVRYKPNGVEIVESTEDADLVILHAIGRRKQLTETAQKLKKPYAVIQYALRSTLSPHTIAWMPLWSGARSVWSYYNLDLLCREDGVVPEFNFYHAPLGVSETFTYMPSDKKYMIATSGQSYLTESVRECHKAAQICKMPIFHLGNSLERDGIVSKTGISDEQLALELSKCYFVSGLRRIEGFELPALEGLVCGVKPIFFDKPHYRHWFEDFAYFIPEGTREEVIRDLLDLFVHGDYRVTDDQIRLARERFSWKTIITNFWSTCL